MWFLRTKEPTRRVTYDRCLLNILNSRDFKRIRLITLNAQHESNQKLVLSITLALFIL